jgi:UDP-glucose 4-epimerase
MTRFVVTLNDAVDTIFSALKFALPGEIYIPDIPSVNIVDVAEAMIGDKPIPIEYFGIRPGEKVHEALVSEEETHRTIKRGDYFVIRPKANGISVDSSEPPLSRELSSRDTVMSKDQVKNFLLDQGYIQ